ncbi:hypothetical protein AGMMS49938_19120 [Fibrobacterales bacterium]|nr:hypothetical protein AGMMS49938_19120 [Fibrobacterales bacterium]
MPAKPKKTQPQMPTPMLLPSKDDFVFKMLFGDKRNIDILKDFLTAVLHLNSDELSHITLTNTHLKQEFLKDKLNILDVKATLANGKVIDIEIQVEPFPEMHSRITYYGSKMITEQVGKGGDYSAVKPAVIIVIVDYPLITESKKCHTKFQMLETTEKFPFNDLQEINILDLTKIPAEPDGNVSLWLQFLSTNDEEVLMELAKKRPAIGQALSSLRVISANARNRSLYEAREKGERDQRAREHAAEARGEARALKKALQVLLDAGISKEESKERLGLS